MTDVQKLQFVEVETEDRNPGTGAADTLARPCEDTLNVRPCEDTLNVRPCQLPDTARSTMPGPKGTAGPS